MVDMNFLHKPTMLGLTHLTMHGLHDEWRLARPSHKNALDFRMNQWIDRQLRHLKSGAREGLLITSVDRDCFSSGGDLKAMIDQQFDQDWMARFFALAYNNLKQLHALPQPTLAFLSGVTMGGGAGLAAHCRYRVACHPLRWAMPENGIGLFPDVGMLRILMRSRYPRLGLMVALSGVPLSASDAHYMGLIDAVVMASDWEAVYQRFIRLPAAQWGEAIAGLTPSAVVDEGPLQRHHQQLQSFDEQAEDISQWLALLQAQAGDDPWLLQMISGLQRACPHRLALTKALSSHAAGLSVDQALDVDYALVMGLLEQDCNLQLGVQHWASKRQDRPCWQPDDDQSVDDRAVACWVDEVVAAVLSSP